MATFLIKYELYKDGEYNLGTSKATCWMCKKYLTRLAADIDTAIHFSNYDGKVYSGWAWPVDVTPRFLDTAQTYDLIPSPVWTDEVAGWGRMQEWLAKSIDKDLKEHLTAICVEITRKKKWDFDRFDFDDEDWDYNPMDSDAEDTWGREPDEEFEMVKPGDTDEIQIPSTLANLMETRIAETAVTDAFEEK
jgi:hypothetical protein